MSVRGFFEWTLTIENYMNVDVCFINFSKALDDVSKPKLIYKCCYHNMDYEVTC